MIGCIIQARMGSTRLPGKVMLDVESNKTVLYFVIKQLQSCKLVDKIIVATTTLEDDKQIANFSKHLGVDSFRGSSDNVLDRYYQCAKEYSVSTIVRIPSDKPLIDPEIVDNVVSMFMNSSYDYITNFLPNPTFPSGTEVEVFSINALKKAWEKAKIPSEKEHVTPYILKKTNKNVHGMSADFSNEKEVRDMFKEAVTHYKKIDITNIKQVKKQEPVLRKGRKHL